MASDVQMKPIGSLPPAQRKTAKSIAGYNVSKSTPLRLKADNVHITPKPISRDQASSTELQKLKVAEKAKLLPLKQKLQSLHPSGDKLHTYHELFNRDSAEDVVLDFVGLIESFLDDHPHAVFFLHDKGSSLNVVCQEQLEEVLATVDEALVEYSNLDKRLSQAMTQGKVLEDHIASEVILRKEFTMVRTKYEILQNGYNKMSRELGSLGDAHEELKLSCGETEVERDNLLQSRDELQESLDEECEISQALQGDKGSLLRSKARRDERIRELVEEKTDLTASVKQKASKLKGLDEQLHAKVATFDKLKLRSETLQKQVDRYEIDLESSHTTADGIYNDLAALRLEKTEAAKTVAELQAANQTLLHEEQCLNVRVRALEREATEHQAAYSEVEERSRCLVEENAELEESRKSLKDDNKKQQHALDIIRGEYDQLKTQASQTMSEYKQLKADHADKSEALEALQAEHEKLQTEHEELQTEHEELQTEQEKLQTEHEELQTEQEKLQEQETFHTSEIERLNADCADNLKAIGTLRAEGEQSKKGEQQKIAEVKNLQAELKRERAAYKALQEELEQQKQQSNLSQKQVEACQLTNTELEETNKRSRATERAELARHEEKLKSCQSELTKAKDREGDCQTTLKHLRDQNSQWEASCSKVNSELSELQEQVTTLRDDNSGKAGSITQLQSSLDGLTLEHTRAEADKQVLAEQLSLAEGQARKLPSYQSLLNLMCLSPNAKSLDLDGLERSLKHMEDIRSMLPTECIQPGGFTAITGLARPRCEGTVSNESCHYLLTAHNPSEHLTVSGLETLQLLLRSQKQSLDVCLAAIYAVAVHIVSIGHLQFNGSMLFLRSIEILTAYAFHEELKTTLKALLESAIPRLACSSILIRSLAYMLQKNLKNTPCSLVQVLKEQSMSSSLMLANYIFIPDGGNLLLIDDKSRIGFVRPHAFDLELNAIEGYCLNFNNAPLVGTWQTPMWPLDDDVSISHVLNAALERLENHVVCEVSTADFHLKIETAS